MTDDPTATVQRLLIEGQGVPDSKVTPNARIVHDLGVDGDDVGDVLQSLHEQFGTDFAELEHQWRTFFNTEGFSPRAGLIAIPAVILCGAVGGVVAGWLRWPAIIGAIVTLALLVGVVWLTSRWLGRDLKPITVEGLAEIVRSGRWPSDPADVR